MNSGRLNDWLQVAANVGIVAGLVLVGVQLKQNSDLLKTQMMYEESNRAIDIETKVVGENGAEIWAKSITDPENLSVAEQRVIEALLWSYTEQLRATRMLAQLGLLNDEDWRQRVEADSAFYLANNYGRAWWANYSAGGDFPDDLVAAINERLSRVDTNFTGKYLKGIMDILQKQSLNDRREPELAN